MEANLHRFPDMPSLIDALVELTCRELRQSLARGRRASLVVPGGSTPVPFYVRLAQQPLAWERIFITLTDERWVSTRHRASNERLMREHLFRDAAASAQVVGLKSFGANSEAGAKRAWQRLEVMPRPFDIVVMGMGDDGHIASLFPDDPASALGLDSAQPPGCVAAKAPAEPSLRVSLNLSALLQTRQLVLLATGDRKLQLIEQEGVPAVSKRLPLHHLLVQQRVPVQVYWTR
jgi:6-phosphogluconolactonase